MAHHQRRGIRLRDLPLDPGILERNRDVASELRPGFDTQGPDDEHQRATKREPTARPIPKVAGDGGAR